MEQKIRQNEENVLYFISEYSIKAKNALEKQIHEYADAYKDTIIKQSSLGKIKEGWQAIIDNYKGRSTLPEFRTHDMYQDGLYIRLCDTYDLILKRVRDII